MVLQETDIIPPLTSQREALLRLVDDEKNDFSQRVKTHHELLATLNFAINTLAPISRLPAELLAEIFRLTLPDVIRVDKDKHLPPVVFLSVSKTFARVALGTPDLWSTILFDTLSEREIEAGHRWVQRAGDGALELKMEPNDTNVHNAPSFLTKIVYPNRQRVTSLCFPVTIPTLPHFFAHYGILDTLEVSVSPRLNYNVPKFVDPCLPELQHLHFPALRHLILRHYSRLNPLPLHDRIPWTSLTSLELECTFGHQAAPLLELVSLCSSLVYAKLWLGGDSQHRSTAQDVTLPHLRTLCLVVVNTNESSFIDNLTMPSLIELKLRYRHPKSIHVTRKKWPGDAYVALRTRSSLDLRKLDIWEAHLQSGREICAFIRDMPHLRTLRLVRIQNPNRTLYGLVHVDSQSGPLAPRLTCLDVNVASGSDSVDDVEGIVADIIESRWSVDCIKRPRWVFVRLPRGERDLDVAQKFESFREQGLELVVHYKD